jgi:uncharacterized membrane protein YccC
LDASFLSSRDPDLHATRRAGRAAIAVPVLLWVGKDVLGNPVLGTFAVLGSIALLVFVDFSGSIAERVIAQSTLVLASAVLVCLGTLASTASWVAAVATLLVTFVLLFAGVLSSLLAGATTTLLVSFLLPVTLAGGSAAISDRLFGWLLAGAVSIPAVCLLWPAPSSDPLRMRAAAACRRLASQLRAEASCVGEQFDTASLGTLERVREDAAGAVEDLRGAFFSTPYRPTGLSTSSRAIVRATDKLIWLDRVLSRAPLGRPPAPAESAVCELSRATAEVLETGGAMLLAPRCEAGELDMQLRRLREKRDELEQAIASCAGEGAADQIGLISSLQPGFRAQEVSFVVAAAAADIQLEAAARRRSWGQRLLGSEPDEHGSAWSSVRQRAIAHLQLRSVRMHNSLRGAAAFALAVLVAELSNVQHGFWVVFGTLAVLRSNALSTGQDTLRALAGTAAGILLGGGLVALVGAGSTASWFLLAPAVALIALGPVVISFTAGQVGFTTTLLVLTNIIAPAGWSVGLVRLTDVAIGCGVSIAVGCLFWPRGAGRALGLSLADGFTASAQYAHAAVEYGISRCDSKAPKVAEPSLELGLAAAAGRRVDDAFRAYAAERGSKRMKLADLATLIGAISLLRLTGDAVLDLWDRDGNPLGGEREAARGELRELSVSVMGWYEQAAQALAGMGATPPRLVQDATANARLTGIVQRDLRGAGAEAASTAVKMIWTADHVEVARELQAEIADPTARAAALQAKRS